MTHPHPTLPLPGTVLEVLTFEMGGEAFALDAVLVQEILDVGPRTTVPGADALVGHVINFRGRVIPLADLRPAFGIEQTATTVDSRIIVIELTLADEPMLVGLSADSVTEVATFQADACEEPPMIGMRWPRAHVRGLVRRADGVVVLPNLHGLFRSLVDRTGHTTIH